MLVFVLNQAKKASTGKIQTPVYENVREFGGVAGWTAFPSLFFLEGNVVGDSLDTASEKVPFALLGNVRTHFGVGTI